METDLSGEIKVHVLEPKAVMTDYDNIKIIRIKSRDFNLCIMKDYWPIVGEINGSCYLEGENTKGYENINAFYSMSHNVFNLIIKNYVKVAVKDKYEEYNLKGKRILVVDDTKFNLNLAKRLISKYGADIDFASSGQECLDIITKDQKYDMILLDDMMPGMTGPETLVKLKEIPEYKNPVIALTANEQEGMEQKYKSIGFNDYISKPIHVEELEKLFAKYLINIVEESNLPDVELNLNDKVEIKEKTKEDK